MFVGHYSASFIAKGLEPRASLALLFVAAQFLDFVFFPLVLIGAEDLLIHENATASTHFLLPFMPWSHSVWAALIWPIAVFLFAIRFLRVGKTTALLLALITSSHWLLDLLVHDGDLAIWSIFDDDAIKLGMGLWHQALIAFLLECTLLILATLFYLKRSHSVNRLGKIGPIIFVSTLIIVQALFNFGPFVDVSHEVFAIAAFVTLVLFTLIAGFLDPNRLGGAQSEL